MASAISYELFSSKQAAANGLATLDATAKIPIAQLPSSVIKNYKGEFETDSALKTAHTTGIMGDYAYVTASSSYWYWNEALETAGWVNQQISETEYNALSAQAKAAVPYIVGV